MNLHPNHLSLAMLNWMQSMSAWQIAKHVSSNSNGSLLDRLSPLANHQLKSNPQRKNPRQKNRNPRPSAQAANHASAPSVNPTDVFRDPEFLRILQREAELRTHSALDGLKHYQAIDREHEPSYCRTLWRRGTTELNDYGADLPKTAPCLLLVPSLINRAHIFDLYAEVSVVSTLVSLGVRPLVLDWNEPGLQERRFDCADYVTYRVTEALSQAQRLYDSVHLLGYCMGGILAQAAAQTAWTKPTSLILLSTPWDMSPFHLPEFTEESIAQMREWIMRQDVMPDWWSSAVFQLKDPFRFQRKFTRFLQMNEKEQQHFAFVEDWAQDGVPLSRYVARECLIDWPQSNPLLNESWRVAGHSITTHAPCPTLCVIPKRDKIVPPTSAQPLADTADHILTPDCGHISLVVGQRASQSLWKPIAKWCGAG